MSYKNKIIPAIKSYLMKDNNIIFALLFGSLNNSIERKMSDIDIGIFYKKEIELLDLGKIIFDLEIIAQKRIDLVELNNIYSVNPLLAYNIISNSELLFSREEKLYIDFKRRTYQSYFDSTRLRDMTNKALYKRITENKFGKRNYA